MNAHNNNPSIEIVKKSHKIQSVKIIMPVWRRLGNDGVTYVTLPFLGLNTYGKGPDDVDKAIEESIIAFCIASEECGLGIDSELEFFGWKRISETIDSIVFSINVDNPYMEEVMDTGLEMAYDLNMPNDSILECA